MEAVSENGRSREKDDSIDQLIRDKTSLTARLKTHTDGNASAQSEREAILEAETKTLQTIIDRLRK